MAFNPVTRSTSAGADSARRGLRSSRTRRALAAPALVLRVTGLNAMVGVIYDFIGRPLIDGEERDDATTSQPQAAPPKKGDNTA